MVDIRESRDPVKNPIIVLDISRSRFASWVLFLPIKKTSLYKERAATDPEKKAMLDFVYVNAHLNLTQFARKRGDA